jgi:hypothetical protein
MSHYRKYVSQLIQSCSFITGSMFHSCYKIYSLLLGIYFTVDPKPQFYYREYVSQLIQSRCFIYREYVLSLIHSKASLNLKRALWGDKPEGLLPENCPNFLADRENYRTLCQRARESFLREKLLFITGSIFHL